MSKGTQILSVEPAPDKPLCPCLTLEVKHSGIENIVMAFVGRKPNCEAERECREVWTQNGWDMHWAKMAFGILFTVQHTFYYKTQRCRLRPEDWLADRRQVSPDRCRSRWGLIRSGQVYEEVHKLQADKKFSHSQLDLWKWPYLGTTVVKISRVQNKTTAASATKQAAT